MTQLDWRTKLESLFVSLERMMGLRVTVNDIHGFFCDREGNSFVDPDRIYHDLDFCQQADRKKCVEHECKKANTVAAQKDGPFIWPCWCGPLQIAMPLKWRGQHAGIIFLGPFHPVSSRVEYPESPAGEDDLPRYNMDNFEADAQVLDAIGIGIVERTDSIKIHGKGERWEKIYRLYTGRVADKIGIKDVATELNLSPSRASHLVSELFGMPFEQLLLEHRLQRTAALLESTDLTLAEIAEMVGFCDIYHLSKMFKRKFNTPPGAYRAGERR